MKFTRLFTCTALLQGFTLWWLHKSPDHGAGLLNSLFHFAAIWLVITIPLVIYWTQSVKELPKRIRASAILFYSVFFPALGAYLSWSGGAASGLIASAVLCFVSLHLLLGFDFVERRWKYELLFRYSWRNAMLGLTAGVVTGLFWLVLFAGAKLMALINVHWVNELIQAPLFIYPVTSLVVAGGFALGLNRTAITESTQRLLISVASWLLLLVLFFGVLFAVILPFEGLTTLFSTKLAAMLLCWFAALAVTFASCVYQDGTFKSPYSSWVSRATQLAWLSLLPIAAVACWAIYLRVDQYGWTEERLWATLVAKLVVIYAVGYSLCWFDRSRWMSFIGRTNIVAAIVLCIGIVALLSPIADTNRVSVNSQLKRIKEQNIEPDWFYLKWNSGRFGRDALEAMATDPQNKWSKKAKETLAQPSSPLTSPVKPVKPEEFINRLNVFPKGKTLPTTFADYLTSPYLDSQLKNCVTFNSTCDVWVGDLNGNGQDVVILFDKTPQPPSPPFSHFPGRQGVLFSITDNQWNAVGYLAGEVRPDMTGDQLENAKVISSNWRDLIIAGVRYRVVLVNKPAELKIKQK